MASRFTYSRWDGTQRGFEVDADALLDELADDLTYHGDINTALRKLMQNGMRDAEDREIPGLRELMKRLREQRQQIQERGDLGGVYQEIADELSDIVDEERHVAGNNFTLDMLPDDLAGRIRELQHYDFQSKEAERRFENLMEKLREQLMQQQLDKMSSAVQNMSPEQMARTKDMMAALNNMLERRRNGEDPQFEQFMEEFGDFFPENPQSLDELLEGMAKRMAMAQAMLNSMTPEQRAQLQQLSDQLLEDMDLRWQMDQLSQNLQGMFPDAGWGKQYDFSGQDPLGFQEAMQSMQDLSDLEQLENLMKSASTPAALAEADIARSSQGLGTRSR